MCLSDGLQLSLSVGCNIDVPFGRQFYPKLLTRPMHAFLAWLVPVGVKSLTQAVLISFSVTRGTKPACVPFNLLLYSKAAVWDFGPWERNNPTASPTTIPKREIKCRIEK